MVGLREQNKALRREAILDAMLELLGTHHPTEITTGQIAAVANVSPATVFNLIGTREELLRALSVRVIDTLLDALVDLNKRTGGDPIAAARLIVDASVAAFTAESTAYRRVISEIAFHHDVDERLRLQPAKLQEAAMREAQEREIIDARFDPAGLGKQIFASYFAAMLSWASRRIDDDGFLIVARHGLLTVLAAAATDDYRGGFRNELVALSTSWAALPQPT